MIASFLAAWMFLTRVPLPARWSLHDEESVRRSVAWFGVLGLVIGALAGLPFLIESLPSHYAALLSIAIALLITGALHEDGFADSCDGIFGGGTPEKRLEIMRDSRVGAFGVLGLLLALGFRFFLLKDLAERDGRELPAILAAVAALSRSTAVALIYADSRRAAEEGSPGESKVSRFYQGPRFVDVLLTVGASVTAGFLLLGGGLMAAGIGVAVLLAGIGFVFFRRMLGRLTGDALGACIVAIEIAVLAAILSGFPAQRAESMGAWGNAPGLGGGAMRQAEGLLHPKVEEDFQPSPYVGTKTWGVAPGYGERRLQRESGCVDFGYVGFDILHPE